MFRYEIGARVLVRRYDWDEIGKAIEVKILDKVPTFIKAEVLSDGWFRIGEVHWLSDKEWFSISRVVYHY